MRKAKQSSTVVFPAGGAGGRTAAGMKAEHNRLQHSCHELSARAITLMQLFHSDQIQWCERRSLIGVTIN